MGAAMRTKTTRPDRTMPCRVCGKMVAHRYIGDQVMPRETLTLWNSTCHEATRTPETLPEAAARVQQESPNA